MLTADLFHIPYVYKSSPDGGIKKTLITNSFSKSTARKITNLVPMTTQDTPLFITNYENSVSL